MKDYLEKQGKLLNTLGRKKDSLESEMNKLLEEYPFLKRFTELKESLEDINLSYEETFNDSIEKFLFLVSKVISLLI